MPHVVTSKEQKQREIINYISQNQYCLAQDVVIGLQNKISRGPIFTLLEELVRVGLIKNEKAKSNARDNRFFVEGTNPFLVANKELDEFQALFFKLLSDIKNKQPSAFQFSGARKWKKMMEEHNSHEGVGKVSIDSVEWMFSETFGILHEMITVYHAYLDRVLFIAQSFWSRQIHDKETRRGFLGMILDRIIDLEDTLVQSFDEPMRKHVENKLSFWDNEKLHSIYHEMSSEGSNTTAYIMAVAKEFKMPGFERLVEMTKLPMGVNVL